MMTKCCTVVAGRQQAMSLVIFVMLLILQTAVPGMADADDQKPVAVIDGTLLVNVGKTIYLDGSLSSDPGGSPLDYTWTLMSAPEGSMATMEDSNDRQAKFQADVAGTYRVKLTVNNGLTDSDPAYATVIVTGEGTE